MGRGRQLGAAVVAAVLATGLLAGPSAAKGGDGRIVKRGSCTAASDWSLAARPVGGSIEVKFVVDSVRVGQLWTWTVRHDGWTRHSGRRTTRASGATFDLARRLVDAPGRHQVSATARNQRTGELCRAWLRI